MTTDTELEDKQPSTLKEDELFIRLKKMIVAGAQKSSKWRIEARKDFAFEAGDQWEEIDRARLRDQMRPCVTFNRTKATVSAVTGMEVTARQEVRYIPRTMEDEGINELYTDAAEWVRDECDAEDEESDMFTDDVVCGMGWTETLLNYDDDPNGKIEVERGDALDHYWDPAAVKRNLVDAKWKAKAKRMSLESAKELFPDADPDMLHAYWLDRSQKDDEDAPSDFEERKYHGDGEQTKKRDEVIIVQVQWCEYEPYHRVINPTTQKEEEVSTQDFKKLKKRLPEIISVKAKRKVIKQAFLGGEVLESGDAPSQKDMTLQCVTGYRDRNTRTWFGLVRLMRDPQQWANTFLSTIMHQIATSGKGMMAEQGAFIDGDARSVEEKWSAADNISVFANGALSGAKIQPKPQASIPPGLAQLLEFAVSSIRDVTGVNIETLGLADRQQAASLEAQRRQAATTMLASFFDSLRRYRKVQGRVLLDMIRHYLPENTLIRISGEDGKKYVPFVQSDEVVEFDVIVDEQATSPNQKERTWDILQQLMPQLAKMGLPAQAWKVLTEYSPLPESAVQELFKAIEEGSSNKGPSPDEVKAQAEMQKSQMEAKQSEAQMALDRERMQQELLISQNETQVRMAELEVERMKIAQSQATVETQAGPAITMQQAGEHMGKQSEMLSQALAAIAQATAVMAQSSAQTQQAITLLTKVSTAPTEFILDPVSGMPIGAQKVMGTMQ